MTTNRNGTGLTGQGMGQGMNEPSMGGSNLDQRFDALKDKAKDIVDQGSEKVQEFKTRVVEVKDKAMARGGDFLERVTTLIKANPLRSVAIAFGVGYIGMRLFRR